MCSTTIAGKDTLDWISYEINYLHKLFRFDLNRMEKGLPPPPSGVGVHRNAISPLRLPFP